MKKMKLFILTLSIALISQLALSQKSTINVNYMDQEVNATDDFFLFSNGEWIKNNEIPASESRWGSFNELDRANKDKITDILLQLNFSSKRSMNYLIIKNS
jgi:predicted metalloendopeptidase